MVKGLLPIHIIAGALGLLSGFVALYAAKGAGLHRRSGIVFVCVMLTMALTGMTIAIGRPSQEVNVAAALMTAYLVTTSLTTVHPLTAASRRLDLALLVVAAIVGMTQLTFGLQALSGGGTRNGVPAFPFFLFGLIAMLGSIGDVRVMRSGALQGAPRLARHLWRMTCALLIASLSFPRLLPQSMRIVPVVALPVVAILVTMVYWLWRVRGRRTVRAMIGVTVPQAV